MSSPASFFSGWIGFGSGLTSLTLTEPTDTGYVRRPITYAPIDGACVRDISAGSVGPATIAWTSLYLAGLFDAQADGNLLAVIPMAPPLTAGVGQTITTSQQFSFRISASSEISPLTTMTWLAGSELGKTSRGSVITACSNLQLSGGTLAAIPIAQSIFSASSLPSVAPAAGSGQLWNNGGVICIA